MKLPLFIFTINLLFASIYPVHDRINHLLAESDSDSITTQNSVQVDTLDRFVTLSPKSPARALFLSSIFPGAGELYMGNKLRGALFIGIEAAAVGTWYVYNQKGSDQQDAYKAYADEHWNLSRWIHDYYKWNDDDILDVNGKNARSIFVGSSVFGEDTTYYYPDIWEDSHHVRYTWTGDPRMVHTNNDEFRSIYRDMCGYTSTCNSSTQEQIEAFLVEKEYNLEKNHHFYENIGKYDHFYAGWDDNDSLYMIIKEEGGEKLAMSPNKAEYRNMWTSANEDFFQIATYALSVIMANHVVSMVDALLLAKLSQYTEDVEVSAQPYFNSGTPYGVSGVNLSIIW